MRKEILSLALLALAVAMPARAQTVADQINTLSAQMQLLAKQQELNQALAKMAGTDVASLPRVIAVYGVEGKLQARLLLTGGMVSTFEEGDAIRGAMRVIGITPRTVLVEIKNGKKAATVPLEFVASAAQSQQGLSAGAAMPGGVPGSPLPPELLPSPPAVGTTVLPLPMTRAAPAGGIPPMPAPAAASPVGVPPGGTPVPGPSGAPPAGLAPRAPGAAPATPNVPGAPVAAAPATAR